MNPDSIEPIPHTRAGRWWRRWAGSIAFVTLILLATAGFYKVEINRYDGCQAGNLLRSGLREAEYQRIEQSASIDRELLFPDIPEETYQELLKDSEEQALDRIQDLYGPRPCGTVWPFRG